MMPMIWLKESILASVFFLFVFSSPGSSANVDPLHNTTYDFWFEKYTKLYMPIVDWKILKSQCFAESSFRENAVSPVGAQGLCQFMPATWNDVQSGLKIRGNPFDPKMNVQFAAYYMGKLRASWTSRRPERDRHSLAMASYNAGLGNLLKAQKKCNNAVLYPGIVQCLPDITGKHSEETTTYVTRIWQYYVRLILF